MLYKCKGDFMNLLFDKELKRDINSINDLSHYFYKKLKDGVAEKKNDIKLDDYEEYGFDFNESQDAMALILTKRNDKSIKHNDEIMRNLFGNMDPKYCWEHYSKEIMMFIEDESIDDWIRHVAIKTIDITTETGKEAIEAIERKKKQGKAVSDVEEALLRLVEKKKDNPNKEEPKVGFKFP